MEKVLVWEEDFEFVLEQLKSCGGKEKLEWVKPKLIEIMERAETVYNKYHGGDFYEVPLKVWEIAAKLVYGE